MPATLYFEFFEIGDFRLTDDLQAPTMKVMRESCQRKTELLNARDCQVARAEAFSAREDAQFKLWRSMSQEFRNSD